MEDDKRTSLIPPLQHLAIIMDGNGRWAQQRGLPRIAGHQRGVETVTTIVNECVKQDIRFLSLFAFSSENWGRPRREVDALMDLLLQFLSSQRPIMLDNAISLKVIGDTSRLSEKVRSALATTAQETAGGDNLTLILALSYGGRDDILRAARRAAEEVQKGCLSPTALDDSYFSSCLDTSGIPDPDLLIRTSGEMRISNFLLWQAAYTELYFTDVLWPDFSVVEMHKAINVYRRRKRRFGLTEEQLDASPDLIKGVGD